MAQFNYKARRKSGEVVTGVLDVPDRAAALAQIERQGLFPVTILVSKTIGKAERAKDKHEKRQATTHALPSLLRGLGRGQRKPGLKELSTFTQQMANLLRSGMPLTVALNSMTHLESKGIPSDVSRQLKQDVMEGKSLSDAMARQPVIFSDMYVNMVRAGEQSGALEEVLRRLASHFERFAEVQQKFISALIYPAIVACVGIVVIFFFMTYMLPKFLQIFEGMRIPLPPSTQALILISHFFSHYSWILVGVVVVVVIVFQRYKSTDAGRRTLDRFKMDAPIVGKVVRLNLFGQFARTLGTLLQNGVPVLTALKITEQIMPNVILKNAIAKTREDVTDGKTIAQPLAKSKIFPQLMLDLLKIGEETCDVPGALQNVAETYENELNIALRVMTNLIEPVMIIIMAAGVGGLLFSILSAMFAVTSSIGKS